MGRASSVRVDNGTYLAHPSLAVGDNGRAMPVLASGFTHVVAVTSTAARTAVDFSTTCKIITIRVSGANVFFRLGDDTVVAVNDANDPFLLDTEIHDEPIYEDGGGISTDLVHDRISIIAATGETATVWVTERE